MAPPGSTPPSTSRAPTSRRRTCPSMVRRIPLPAILSGDVHFAMDNLASYGPVIQEGRMRALAMTSAERWPALPDVPPMEEAGMGGFEVTSWYLWAAPAGAKTE